MIVDCECCSVRGIACGDCVIGVLLASPAAGPDAAVDQPSGASMVHFDATEQRALDELAAQGLIPRLRLVAGEPRRVPWIVHSSDKERDVG